MVDSSKNNNDKNKLTHDAYILNLSIQILFYFTTVHRFINLLIEASS